MLKNVAICDGSCLKNPGPGGWAFAVINDVVEFRYGSSDSSTNNIMELTAIITALKECSAKVLYTDSSYVVNGINKWIHGWKKSGWINSEKKVVKNLELWKDLDILNGQKKPEIRWIRGHATTSGVTDKHERLLINVQNMVDEFAREAAINKSNGSRSIDVSKFGV